VPVAAQVRDNWRARTTTSLLGSDPVGARRPVSL